MKNLTTLILATATLASFAQTITPISTGQTTGHIATISVHNPSDEPITAFVPPDGNINKLSINGTPIFQANENRGKYFYIPSHGKYQSYVATSAAPPPGTAAGNITIPPGDTLHISTTGYCADLHTPPVPDGDAMPPLSEWIGGDGNIPPPGSGIPDGFTPAKNPDKLPFITANVPNQIPGKPLTTSIDKNPEAVEYIFHAIDQITTVYDSLSDEGAISTPFSGNDDKERESVIQQTIWIYTSTLTGEPYTKPQFHDRMVAQYENNTGTNINDAPAATVVKIDAGVDDFWNTFTTVGAEAKVISVNPGFPHQDKLENVFGNSDKSGVSAKTGDAASEAAKATGAKAIADGAKIHPTPGADDSLLGEEVVHDHQNAPQPDAVPSAMMDALRAGAAAAGANNPAPTKQPEKPTPPHPAESPPACACREFTAEVSFPEINRGRPPISIKVNPNMQTPATVNITASVSEMHQTNSTKLRIENIKLTCDCDNAPCPVIPIPDISPAATATGAPAAAQAAEQDAPPTGSTTSGAETRSNPNTQGSGQPASGTAESDAHYKVKLQQNHSQLRLRDGQQHEQRTDNTAEYDFERLPLQRSKHTARVEIEAACATATCPKAKCIADVHITLEIR